MTIDPASLSEEPAGTEGGNFIISRIRGALQGFVNWVVTKFIEDDTRWDEITNTVIRELDKLIADLVPAIIDRLRNAISLGLTGEPLFDFESESDAVEEETEGVRRTNGYNPG